MNIRNLEIINLYRAFKELVLDPFDNDILAVDKYQNITGTEMNSFCPAHNRRVEGMPGSRDDLFAVHMDMNQLVRLVDIGLNNGL